MTMLAAFDVLLWRYSGQADFVVGTPIAGRNTSEVEGLIGYFANTLPLRVELGNNPKFNELMLQVRECALEAYAHQDVPFDRLVEELQPQRSLSHTPLFQVIFAFENTAPVRSFPGLKMKSLDVDRGTARCDLSLFATDKGEELNCLWEYSTDLFKAETIAQLIASYQHLLESILRDPLQRISELDLWSESQRSRLIEQSTSAAPSTQRSADQSAPPIMPRLFEAIAAEIPDALALVSITERLTYRELNLRANRIAHLLQRLGVGPEVPVGVCLGRSANLIVALLAVLKSGGAYVPIDPNYPAARVAFMLSDSGIDVLLTETRLLEMLSETQARKVCLDDPAELGDEHDPALNENPASQVTPANLAYVIYTSGSTGRPKGVQVNHQTVVHLFEATRLQLGFHEREIWTVVHSSAFDFSVWEIWGSLLQRGTLVVAPLEVVQSPAELFELLCRERVTILNQTPAALRELLLYREQHLSTGDANRDWHVRLIVCGGDAMDQELALRLSELELPVWNFYGPTESTVWTTCGLVGQAPQLPNALGQPIADQQVYLLDQYLQLAPNGVAAELVIGGAGLARGYANRPELTAERFIPNPFSVEPGSRLYRTGDLVRRHKDGTLEYAGRIDHQVKLRGFRVELGEIESALSQYPSIAQAVAVVREDRPGDHRLVAYLISKDSQTVDISALRRHLQWSLPDYMVPSIFVTLTALPLTPNQKVDRRRLPPPDYTAMDSTAEFVAPRNAVEEIVAGIWARVLGLDKVSIDADFFALGGHSLLATQVVSRIHDAFQISLPLRLLFERATVAGLAAQIAVAQLSQAGIQPPPLVPVKRSARLPLSFAQQRLWFLDQLEPGSPFYNVARAVRLSGQLDTTALSVAIAEIVRRHESLRTSFGTDAGTPFQRAAEFDTVPWRFIDLTQVDESVRESQAKEMAGTEIKQPFDLTQDLLLRALLLKLSDEEHVLIITLHHIAADGWSIGVLFRELIALYRNSVTGQATSLPALPVQYADYAVWQRQWLQGEVLEELLSYWRNQLAGAPQILRLPTDKPRPSVQGFRGAHETLTLPAALVSRLRNVSQARGATLFMTLLAGFQLLLSRFSGQQDLIVGTDVANRNRVETENLIGFFTNLLPLRSRIAPEVSFTELLAQVRETTLAAQTHQDLPFEKLVEELRPERDLSRNPLVQVLLVMNQPPLKIDLPHLDVSRFELPLENSRFDLVLFLSESENGLAGFWLYNPDLFEAETISRLSLEFAGLLSQIAGDPEATLGSFQVFAEAARQKEMDKEQQQQAQLERLRGRRRKAVDLNRVSGVTMGSLLPGQQLPLLIEPDHEALDLALWAAENQSVIEQKLLQHGAILFRGFAVQSVPQFEEFAAIICPDLFGEYGDLPREELGGKVYGSTPYPADETILFHNESSHMHRWPMLIWFYCVKAALVGGESPIIDCRRIYQELEPTLRQRFEEKGLRYVRNFTDGLDVSWQSFFQTEDRAAVEKYCRAAGIDFSWTGNNNLRTTQTCPAVVTHPQTGEKVFFNQLQLHHIYCLAPAVRESLLAMMSRDELPRNVYYGDGSIIEDSVMEYLGSLYAQLSVGFPWRERDVLMLNNMLVAHSRNPFAGERKIVVALGNLISKEEV
jgi:amino acid adenylation domain-containing protein